MIRETVNALLACVVTFALCAIAYPAAVYGLGHTLFPKQARGSLIERDGKIVGSELIAQPFASDKYFSPRPSAAGATGYAADAASGSNLATTNPALRDRIALDAARQIASRTGDAELKTSLERLDALQAELKAKKEIKEPSQDDADAVVKLEGEVPTAQAKVLDRSSGLGESDEFRVPIDLVTTSGAGLDPHISPEAARYQAPRVAAARGLTPERVEALIEADTDRSGEFIGAPSRVNVLLLNLDLDREAPGPKPPAVTPTATPSVAAPPAPVAEAVSAITASLNALSSRVDTLQERVGAAPDANAATEVKDLRARVDRITDDLSPTAESVRRMDELVKRVATLGRDLDAVRSEAKLARGGDPSAESDKKIQAIRMEVQSLKGSFMRLEAASRDAKAQPPGLDPAVKLFQSKQYAESARAFRALTLSHPDDARVWYFAALAQGLSTSQWQGAEVLELVHKGGEREQAGTPSSETIDKAFAGLTGETGRDWLAYYRQLVVRR
ncbi:Potassium-transporting ATPase KdpC subunit [Paludisphaera borealis]|uniref:Potassium-transporting ATPase KdpC subunit n=1 Tax=Paludisphaera borealis TaxID=1387353 RepID=A0A1U7CJ44_9BACT|nr:potassium-transporting ATPase subunit C [Paludisphaera borealis]APW58952.1 Potassium-transporting ATPase KdpC subunit [Paludisphaera borealis]